MDKWDYFFIILVVLLIGGLIFRITRVYKLLKGEEDVVTLKRFAPIGIFFGIIGMVQLFFWIKSLIMLEDSFQSSSISSTGLLGIVIALNSFDYNFITKDGVIIISSKYKWDSIEDWHWKKDHYNVAIIRAYVPRKFSKNSPPKLKEIELNVSQKQRERVEKLLIQYIGEETH